MKTVTFDGVVLAPKKVIAVNKVRTFSTGGTACDFSYGFTVYMEGGETITFIEKTHPRRGYSGGPTSKDEHQASENQRNKFIKEVLPNHEDE